MSRKEYIREQRERHGRKAVAVLPIHYPKEILTAMDILAVELWGPPGAPRGSDAGRLQPYVCAVVRNALAFLASGRADVVDGVLFPHTCDSIQGLASLAPDFGGWAKPVFRFLHPKGDARPSARAFIEQEMRALAASLAALTGRALTDDALWAAIRLHDEIDVSRAALLERRAFVDLSDRELYEVLRRGEFLWPDDHLVELDRALMRAHSQRVQTGIPLTVTGYVPEPMAMFDLFRDAGAFVAADDFAAVGRRVRLPRRDRPREGDPFAYLAHEAFNVVPCSTRSADQATRVAHLLNLFARSESRALLIQTVKFCEPELFDVPAIRQAFAARGIPVLHIETELETDLSGQVATRIEALVESVARAGEGARA